MLKTAMVSVAYVFKGSARERRLINFVGTIGKWSMADVFVVAIFLAVLSTHHAETSDRQQFSVFGIQFALDISTQTLSAIGPGFYYFTAYCLLSLLGTQIYPLPRNTLKHAI